MKRIAKTAEFSEEFGSPGQEAFGRDLLCPECGGNNLHMMGLENFNGSDASIKFWCEHCGFDLPHILDLRFHKGSTMVRWFVPNVLAIITDRLTK